MNCSTHCHISHEASARRAFCMPSRACHDCAYSGEHRAIIGFWITADASILRTEAIPMDNKTMARLLAETADLMEIDGADSFRIRSYRRAAEAAEQTTVDLAEAADDTARLMEIDGIGKGMAAQAAGHRRDRLAAPARRAAGQVRRRRAGTAEAARHGAEDCGASVGCGADRQRRPACRGHRGRAARTACRGWAPNRLKSCARGSRTTGGARAGSASTWPMRRRGELRPICSNSKASSR